jgi:hypothetical protein
MASNQGKVQTESKPELLFQHHTLVLLSQAMTGSCALDTCFSLSSEEVLREVQFSFDSDMSLHLLTAWAIRPVDCPSFHRFLRALPVFPLSYEEVRSKHPFSLRLGYVPSPTRCLGYPPF